MTEPLRCSEEEMIDVVRNAGFQVDMVPMVRVNYGWFMSGPSNVQAQSYELESLFNVYRRIYDLQNYDPVQNKFVGSK